MSSAIRKESGSQHTATQTTELQGCRLAVIWMDWYAYHVARFLGLESAPSLSGRVAGIEMVGGVGFHAGLKFREDLPAGIAVDTLLPDSSWQQASKWRLAQLVWQRLSTLDPEAVLVPGYYTLPALAAAAWARLHGRRSILMTESTNYDHVRVGWKEALKRVVIRLCFNWAVAGGKDHVTYLRELGFPADRIAGCYDVVDNAMFNEGTAALRNSATPAQFGLPDSPYFVYVGRHAPEKNVRQLLESWIAYRNGGGSWPLVLVGNGPEHQELRLAAENCPYASDVFFPGLKSSRELLPFYAFAGCFVLPSTREPWGLVVNEAMASSLPVIVSDRCGCAADLVKDGSNGLLFDPSQLGQLAQALTRIASLQHGDLEQMALMSATRIRAYSPQRFGAEVARIVDAPSAAPHANTAERAMAEGVR